MEINNKLKIDSQLIARAQLEAQLAEFDNKINDIPTLKLQIQQIEEELEEYTQKWILLSEVYDNSIYIT